MIFRIYYEYYQEKPEGGAGHWVETDRIVDVESGQELQKIKDEIKSDNDCGYRSRYSFGDIVRLDK